MTIPIARIAVPAATVITLLMSTAHAQSVCRGNPITVQSSASGTLFNRTSSRMIYRSAVRQLTRKWRALAVRRVGRPYIKVNNSGTCRCKLRKRGNSRPRRITWTCT
ncbi:MAG: hypothetical protein ACR2PI_15365, partial [Hyphomicrobiaceae bacterium]